jgi:hypothetical protein
MAALRPGGAIALPSRFLGAFDQAAIGHDILDPWAAGAVMPLLQQHETQELSDARSGLAPVQGVGILLRRRLTMARARSRSSWAE